MPMPLPRRCVCLHGAACASVASWLSLMALLVFPVDVARADEVESAPTSDLLHVWIDRAIEGPLAGQKIAPLASDEEFVRRLFLDLAGRIPSVEEAQAFLADDSPDKRETLIDRLLESPEFPRRMQQAFDVMLMERRGGAAIPSAEWEEYLRQSFAENKPFNVLAREILGADGNEQRPAAKFYLDRGGDLDGLTRDIGRLFLGMDLQCAQCHDHPVIGDYYQSHYYGIYAFINRSYVFVDAKSKLSYFAEKAEGEVAYKSVFDSSVDEKDFKPRLPDGEVLEEPTFDKKEAYVTEPTKEVAGVPKFSRREQLALRATDGSQERFNRNIANRLWYLMMGRGLVHTPDLHHKDNPPSHPELLDRLAKAMVDHQFDVKYMIRELALSNTYQRSSLMPVGMTDEEASPERYAVALLKPLSPEQFAFSLMEATGLSGIERRSQAAKVDKDPRLADLAPEDPQRETLRAKLLEAAVYNALKGSVTQFITLYGSSAGEPEQDFQATVHQALFFNNGAQVQTWLNPRSGNLIERLSAVKDVQAAIDEIYLAILTRLPEETERAEATEYLQQRAGSGVQGLQQLAWALLASSEFRFNH